MDPRSEKKVQVERPSKSARKRRPGLRSAIHARGQPEWEILRAEHYCLPCELLGTPHFHPDMFQTFKILEGEGMLHIGDQSFDAQAGGLGAAQSRALVG
jgi:mannose-6-phosphate isomerase-like protein (cupin superfamily)